jgi:hypothetical protein
MKRKIFKASARNFSVQGAASVKFYSFIMQVSKRLLGKQMGEQAAAE